MKYYLYDDHKGSRDVIKDDGDMCYWLPLKSVYMTKSFLKQWYEIGPSQDNGKYFVAHFYFACNPCNC